MAGFDSFGGLILDRADLNALSEAAGDAKSRDFMMTVAPLPIPRGDRLLLESDSGVFDKSNVTVSGRQKKSCGCGEVLYFQLFEKSYIFRNAKNSVLASC